MRKMILSVTVLSLLVFLGGASLFGKPAAQDSSAAQESTNASKPAHHAAHHAKKAVGENLTAKYAAGVQTLSGTVSMVDAQQKVVVVTNSDGTPFNFRVNKGTKIMVDGKKGSLDDLSGQTSKQVSVKFRDRLNTGLLAQSIEVGG